MQLEETAYYIGLLPSEFWVMTFREFEKFATQRLKRMERENDNNNERLSIMMAHTANMFMKKKGGGKFKASDFYKGKKVENKPMDINVMAEILKAIAIANGGEVNG